MPKLPTRFFPVLLVAGVALALGACKKSRDAVSDTLQAHEAWVRPVADSGGVTAAYVRLTNGMDTPVTITNFASDDASDVELHETITDANNMSSMERRDTVVLNSFDNLVMKPGGTHIMLIGTLRPLKAGDTVRITMKLSTGAIFAVNAPVREP